MTQKPDKLIDGITSAVAVTIAVCSVVVLIAATFAVARWLLT